MFQQGTGYTWVFWHSGSQEFAVGFVTVVGRRQAHTPEKSIVYGMATQKVKTLTLTDNLKLLTLMFLGYGEAEVPGESQHRSLKETTTFYEATVTATALSAPPPSVCFILTLNHVEMKHPFLTNPTLGVGGEMHYTAQWEGKVLTY